MTKREFDIAWTMKHEVYVPDRLDEEESTRCFWIFNEIPCILFIFPL